MARHFAACPAYLKKVEEADRGSGRDRNLYRLGVRDAWGGDYWFHVEMNGEATLDYLDSYLRSIWLECCDHLSIFTTGGWRGEEVEFDSSVEKAFASGKELTHIYDFGTSSETLIKPVGVRKGKPLGKYPIVLLARNDEPEETCMECGKKAEFLCLECIRDYNLSGTLCAKHAESHPHEDSGGLVDLVNSPRCGMCGYSGPAKPPY
jgi:hypothetical protein